MIIARDNDDQLYLFGDEVRPAIFTGTPDGAGTGKETAGRRGVSMEFSFKSANVYSIYGQRAADPGPLICGGGISGSGWFPGVMIHPRFGKIDFRRDDLDVEMLRQIVE